jgi:parvulin-like peptidyl-prolyl cis-trans isomerase-like protein
MQKLSRWLGFLLLCASALGQGGAGKARPSAAHRDSVAMTVGTRQITVSELCTAIEVLPPPQASGFPLHPPLAAQWYGPLVALAEEAKREHLGQTLPPEKGSIVDEENGLAAALIQKIANDVHPTETEIHQYYATHKYEFERTKARHIVISYATAFASRSKRSAAEAKAKAEAISAQLKNGAEFAALAAKESDDPYTRDNGGDLGEVYHHQMDPAEENVLWSLVPDQTSAPFVDRFGYAIVRVEGRRVLPLNDVRETIIGDLKFAADKRRQNEIISAAHISMKKAYMTSPLPCSPSTQARP